MNKILIIIRREYLTRVKRKMFFITTLLIPLLFVGFVSVVTIVSMKDADHQTMVVHDESGFFQDKMKTDSSSNYTLVYGLPQKGENNESFLKRMQGDILVRIFPFKENKMDSVILYNDGGISISAKSYIENKLNDIYIVKQMEEAGINKSKIDSINNSSIQIASRDIKDGKETSTEMAMAIASVTGILMYIIIFIYGAGVMRGVMEEKTNRIAEVIISSVKPFQLMMGKIIGIGMVGLTQFLIWFVFIGSIKFILPLFFPQLHLGGASAVMSNPDMQRQMAEVASDSGAAVWQELQNLPWLTIISCFIIYFLGGYFIYASLFAAVGSLVNEDPQEAQQLTLPITMPIIFGFIIMQSAIKDPNSSMAVFGSIFPLTSPIVMMARLPYHPPVWQIALSIFLLIAGFVFFTWIGAKIYRTGILLYGKRTTWKEVIKWLRKS